MSPQLIKQVVLYAIVLAVLLGGWIDAWWTQHEFTKFKDNIAMQVKVNEQAKQDKETQDAANIQSIATGYSSTIDNLNRRLRNFQTVSGSSGVQLAGIKLRSTSMQKAPSFPSGITSPSTQLSGTDEGSEFYLNALEDAAQLNAVIDAVKRVCM